MKHPQETTVLLAAGLSRRHGARIRSRVPVRHHPIQGRERGNPIILPYALRALVIEDDVALGCRHQTRSCPELVQEAALLADGFYHDLDTRKAFAAERQPKHRAINEVHSHDPIQISPVLPPFQAER